MLFARPMSEYEISLALPQDAPLAVMELHVVEPAEQYAPIDVGSSSL